jgi:hypothetical protein
MAPEELESRHELQPRQGERYIGFGGELRTQRISHDQVRLRQHHLADELARVLARGWLRDVRQQPAHRCMILAAEEWHPGDHGQHMDRRRIRLWCQHEPVSDPDPWFLGDGRLEVVVDAAEDAACSSAEPGVPLVSSLGERSCGSFPHQRASTMYQVIVAAGLFRELVQLVGTVVLGQQAKEYTASPDQRW